MRRKGKTTATGGSIRCVMKKKANVVIGKEPALELETGKGVAGERADEGRDRSAEEGRDGGVLEPVHELRAVKAEDLVEGREGGIEVDPRYEGRQREDIGTLLEGGDGHPIERKEDDHRPHTENDGPEPSGALHDVALSMNLRVAMRSMVADRPAMIRSVKESTAA